MKKVTIKIPKNLTGFLALLFPFILNAQVLDQFPQNQDFYKDGITALYSKIHQIAIKKDLKACANRKGIYHAKILLTKEGNIKFITDFDSLNIKKNKCAYDFSLSVLDSLKDDGSLWIDFVIDENGDIINPIVTPEPHNELFTQRLTPSVKRLSKKSKPAVLDGIPVKAQMTIPHTFSVNFSERQG